jgi:hypothetical protein
MFSFLAQALTLGYALVTSFAKKVMHVVTVEFNQNFPVLCEVALETHVSVRHC